MIPITDKLFFIEGKNRGRYIYSNSLYIDDEQKAIIDTGCGKSILRKLKRKFHLNDENILLIASHVHEDHICGNYLFKNSKIAIHQIEAPILEHIARLAELYGINDPKYKEMNEGFFGIFNLRNYKADIKFRDNFIFNLGELKLQVIHTPGHCAGHCCFLLDKILFLSDIDLSSFGPWYGDISSSVTDFIDSINRVIKLRPDIAISSHKGIYEGKTEIKEELKKFLDKIYHREEKILQFLEKKHSVEEIVKKAFIYGKFPDPAEMFAIAERIMVKLHLNRLLDVEKIEELSKNTYITI